jgi:hypothetical protein
LQGSCLVSFPGWKIVWKPGKSSGVTMTNEPVSTSFPGQSLLFPSLMLIEATIPTAITWIV